MTREQLPEFLRSLAGSARENRRDRQGGAFNRRYGDGLAAQAAVAALEGPEAVVSVAGEPASVGAFVEGLKVAALYAEDVLRAEARAEARATEVFARLTAGIRPR